MKKITSHLVLLLCILPVAVAAENTLYATAGLYRANYDVDNFKERDTGLAGIDFGYSIGEHFAVELGYQELGNISLPGSSAIEVEVTAYQLSLLGSFPLYQNINGYLKLGLDYWEVELSTETDLAGLTLEDSGTDLFYGVGAELALDKKIAVFTEYQFHSEQELQSYGLGLKYFF